MQNWHFGATDGSTNMGIVNHLTCPSCPLEDSTAHIMGGCEHTVMKKQYIARHDQTARMLFSAVIKAKHGRDYMIGDFGKLEELKELGIHSTRVPSFV